MRHAQIINELMDDESIARRRVRLHKFLVMGELVFG